MSSGAQPALRRGALAALLAVFIALHALYNLTIPLGEGPDEPGHLAYVFFLAREGRLPVQRAEAAESDVPGEGHQPPLAYLLAAPAALVLPPEERVVTMSADPRFVWAGGDGPAAFRRGSREFWPWQGIVPAWHLARAVSGLWGLATVALTYLAARALRPGDRPLALLAAALVALNPQFLFSSALVTNDALLAALCAAALWLALVAAGAGQSPAGGRPGLFILLGVIFGLALITKQSALLLGPLLLWAGWRASRGEPRRLVELTLAWGLPALALAGWWFLRNWRLYGDPLGLTVFSAEFAGQPFDWRAPAAWAAALGQLFASFWARFGWMSLPAPGWAVALYAALCGLAGLGWAVAARGRGGKGAGGQGDGGARGRGGKGGSRGAERTLGRARTWAAGLWAGPALLLAMALLWTLSFALTAGLVAWQGRMLFPAIAGAALLLAGGLRRLLRATPAALALGAPLLALAIWMPPGVISPAYGSDVLRPAEAEAGLGTPVYARFAQSWERGVELRGWRLDAAPRAGQPLPITLTWHSLEPIPRSWTVFVHLVAADGTADGTIVAGHNGRPRGEALPFTLWTPGDWVDDTHILELPPELPAGDYALRVGLYRPEKDGQRQGVWDADGGLIGDAAVIGTLTVQP